ncbi:MAG TPA: hypothetical protein VEU97_11460, partial [Ktedonobacteraceae bacterium]|nr:hypothetical protein [Ktedonobacteraceae bacterium]
MRKRWNAWRREEVAIQLLRCIDQSRQDARTRVARVVGVVGVVGYTSVRSRVARVARVVGVAALVQVY